MNKLSVGFVGNFPPFRIAQLNVQILTATRSFVKTAMWTIEETTKAVLNVKLLEVGNITGLQNKKEQEIYLRKF